MNHALIKFQKSAEDRRERYIAAMWLMFLRAPEHKTAPGECVDLGEIGSVREKNWERLTPYSMAQVTSDALRRNPGGCKMMRLYRETLCSISD